MVAGLFHDDVLVWGESKGVGGPRREAGTADQRNQERNWHCQNRQDHGVFDYNLKMEKEIFL